MRKTSVLIIAAAVLLAVAAFALLGQQQPAATKPSAPVRVPSFLPPNNSESIPRIPVGFTQIFNGKDLTGWHVSKTNHHGTTPDFHVVPGGILVASQNPVGSGGMLLTDKRYKNVEFYMEIKPDWGCDGGLFLRSNEAGDAYQVTLDYIPNGTMGYMYGEGLQGVIFIPPGLTPDVLQATQDRLAANWKQAWKREDWNSVRARITGNPPRVSAWINEHPVLQWADTANHAADGAEDGMIGLQLHMGTDRYVAGGFWRWRVIAVRELP
jgi:hypothetical protein